jgi:hypothetical protein
MRQTAGVAIAGLALILIAFATYAASAKKPYDSDFDARVAHPAYPVGGPDVLYDEGHHNAHTAEDGYRALADLVRSDGYALRVTREPFSARTLRGATLVMVVVPRGANDANDQPAFADSEIGALHEWVRGGGSMFLVTDHWPYGPAAEGLAQRFGVGMGSGLVQDSVHCNRDRGDSHLVFSQENGLLRDHPIVRGRSQAERIRRVLTFTGQSIGVPPGGVAFLTLSATATERPPGPPKVRREGGDVRVDMEYGEPEAVGGRAQGIAIEIGKGRVVVLGEAGMLRAQREKAGLVGMNVPGFDNRQLALNIMHWLSRAL